MTDAELVAALAEAMSGVVRLPPHAFAALLPVVHRIAEQRAAEALDDLAQRFRELGQIGAYCVVKARLDARAAALTATPNHGRSAT